VSKERSKRSEVSKSLPTAATPLVLTQRNASTPTNRFYPDETPGAAAARALPPPHARGHQRCNRCCAAVSTRRNASTPAKRPAQQPRSFHLTTGTSALQPPLCRCISMRQNIRRCSRRARAAVTSRQEHQRCSRCCAAASQRPAKRSALQLRSRCGHLTTGTLALQPLLRRCVSTPDAAAACAQLLIQYAAIVAHHVHVIKVEALLWLRLRSSRRRRRRRRTTNIGGVVMVVVRPTVVVGKWVCVGDGVGG